MIVKHIKKTGVPLGLKFKQVILDDRPSVGGLDSELKLFEFKKTIVQNCLVTQQFDAKFVPDELRLPSNADYFAIGQEDNLVKTFFILRKWLQLDVDIGVLSKDESLPASWSQSDTMELPKDRKYQNCLIRLKTR